MTRKVRQANHKLKMTASEPDAVADAKACDPISIERDGCLLRFTDTKGRLLGTLTARSAVGKLMDAGETLLPCEVAWTYPPSSESPHGLLSARIRFGDPDDESVKWSVAKIWGKANDPRPSRTYPVNVVGESHYQEAITNCHVGAGVTLYREIGNPHDDKAIVVKQPGGATIGYVPRGSWLHRIVHEDGMGADATILSLHPGPPIAVVLNVMVRAGELPEAQY